MAKFVLDSYALDSKKSEANAGALGLSVLISWNEIEVPSYAAEKVAQILSQVGIKYSGG